MAPIDKNTPYTTANPKNISVNWKLIIPYQKDKIKEIYHNNAKRLLIAHNEIVDDKYSKKL